MKKFIVCITDYFENEKYTPIKGYEKKYPDYNNDYIEYISNIDTDEAISALFDCDILVSKSVEVTGCVE